MMAMPRDKARDKIKRRYRYELRMKGITPHGRAPLQEQYRFPGDPPLDEAQMAHLVARWRDCDGGKPGNADNILRVTTERVALLENLETYEIRALMDALKDMQACD